MAAPFRFSLATVLRLRRERLNQARRQAAARARTIERLVEQREKAIVMADQQITEVRERLGAGVLNVDQIVWDRRNVAVLRQMAMELAGAMEQQQKLLEREQREVAVAHKAVRALEELEKRRREAFEREEQRRDQREEDERNTQAFARAMQLDPDVAPPGGDL